MPRLPDAEIERLKQDVSLERLIEASGIELKKSGKDFVGRCPFHDDHDPSLRVTPSTNLWRCPPCGIGGSVIDWVMKLNGVSFRHAVELLREGVSSLAAQPVKRTTVRALPPPVTFDADDRALLNQVIDYYRDTLKQSPEALAYLAKRGIDSPEAIERFKLGYANRTLGLRLPNTQRKAGADIRARLAKLGLMRSSGHEHFTGSLVIPVLDEAGHVVEAYGRKIRDDLREGTAYHLYLPGPHQGVWNLDALKASKEIILCEALIDALTFWCAGYRNVTASYGVEGFTADHLVAMKQHGTDRVLIAYDRDDAGEKAAAKLAEKLIAEGIDCYRIQFPKGMDANAYALKVQPASKSLGMAIRKAVWLGKGKAPQVMTEIETPTSDEPAPSVLTSATREREALDAELIPSSLAAEAAASESVALPASPLPEAPAPDIEAKVAGDEVVIVLGDRRYRVRGLPKNMSGEQLKVNVLVSRGDAFHVDTLDLYAARARSGYVTQAAVELRLKEDVIKHDLARMLLKLEALQEEQIQKALAPKKEETAISDSERDEAFALLQSPDLLKRLLDDFERCGLVGEETNKLVCYLAACSRKLDRPLGVVVRSNSAAGKSSLMDGALAFIPEEERIKYSAMTGQALFYMGETNLKHKILAIAEEQGASRASYALKLLQSEGELTIASTGKDPITGNLITQEYHVEGPVMVFLTTTAIDIDPELLNRCLELTVDESREQTRAIHQLQRERRTLEGLIARETREDILTVHRNAQRLLRPLAVMNPYSRYLTFPDETTRLRRDHEKYLTLIDTLALIHQHQRAIKTMPQRGKAIEYIEVTLDDIETANQLAHEVLGRSLDELPPHTRKLLMLIDAMVETNIKKLDIQRADYRFSRREVREHVNWGDTQLRLHLDRLVDLEYVLIHRGGRGQSFVYELLYDGQGKDGKPFLPGLLDVEQLRQRQQAA